MKYFKLTFLLGLLVLFAACSEENLISDHPELSSDGMTIRYKVDGDLELVRSVAAMTHEKNLRTIHLLFFDTEDSEQFVAYKNVEVTPGRGSFTLDPPSTLALDRPYKVLAIGNGDPFSVDGKSLNTWLSTFSGNYNDMLAKLKAYNEDVFTRDNPGQLPFFARFTDSNGDETTFTVTQDGDNLKVPEAETSEFIFSRAVCRFDIHNLVGHLLDIRCARVVNSPVAGYYYVDGVVGGEIAEYIPQDAPTGDGYMPITTDMEPGINTTQRLEGSLYGFPNVVNTTVVNDRVTSALMIAGYYIDPETGVKDSELTYYRFNMANLGESQILNRNYCYRATIKGVRRRGASTEKEAYNDASPIFIYDFTPTWSTDDDNVASDKDGNFLIVNKTHLTFQGDASDVDFVELHVSTNPELEWGVEWVEQTGHNNDKFTFQKISDSAVKCGPIETNDEEYVRYGYLNIVGTNPKTGKTLRVAVYLMQLSTQFKVHTLTVNGNRGAFTQDLDPRGGRIYLPVVTGSPDNIWIATDEGGMLKAWDAANTYITPSGAHNGILEIAYPANITDDTRTATIIVSLKDNEENADGTKKVPDVVVNLVQKKSDQLMEIVNYPQNGVLDIECLEMTGGNPNGVVNPQNFVVRLLDTRYRYRVTTNFDKNRDLVLSATDHRGVGSTNPAKATHPTDGSVQKNDKIEGLTNGQQFWLNPFRTGPGDPMIVGNVTVEAYVPGDASARTETRSFTVRLITADVVMTDVLLKDGTTYRLIADRNFGTPSRIQAGGIENPAQYYDLRSFVKITGMPDPVTNTSYRGNPVTYQVVYELVGNYYTCWGTVTVEDASIISSWIGSNTNVNDFYKSASNWRIPNNDQGDVTSMSRACRYSKERAFFVSDFKISNKFVCCWLSTTLDNNGNSRYNLNPRNNIVSYNHTKYLIQVANKAGTFTMLSNLTNANNRVSYVYYTRLIAPFSDAAWVQKARDAYGYTIP